MAFSGIIDRTSPITLARLLERIYDADEPGELRLVHGDTKETAVLVISRGEVVSSQCGELTGEAAMKQLGSTFPWSYHFAARNAKASSGPEADTSQLPMPRPTKRPALKLKPLLASDEGSASTATAPAMVPTIDAPPAPAGEPSPMRAPVRKAVMLTPSKPQVTAPAVQESVILSDISNVFTPLDRPLLRLMGEPLAGVALPEDFVAVPEFPPVTPRASEAKPMLALSADRLSGWVAGGDDHFIRFAESAGAWQGAVDPADWEYFRADYHWLRSMAEAIGQSLGFTLPLTMAVAEPQRAAAYARLEDGYAGILGGKGAGVAQVLQFNRDALE